MGPVIVKLKPIRQLVLYEGVPYSRELFDFSLWDRFVMTLSAHHIEKRPQTIEGRANHQDALINSQRGMTESLRIVRFYNPDSIIDNTFSGHSQFK